MDRWWVRPTNPATAIYSIHHSEQDRTYYRVCCRGPAGEQVFDLSHDAVTNLWVLDVAHDGSAAAASGAVHVPEVGPSQAEPSQAEPSQAEPRRAKPSLFRVPVAPAVNRITDHANAGRGRAAPVHALASPTPST
jgi:hypothetical protein